MTSCCCWLIQPATATTRNCNTGEKATDGASLAEALGGHERRDPASVQCRIRPSDGVDRVLGQYTDATSKARATEREIPTFRRRNGVGTGAPALTDKLLGLQGHKRVDSGCTPGGKVAGDQHRSSDEQRDREQHRHPGQPHVGEHGGRRTCDQGTGLFATLGLIALTLAAAGRSVRLAAEERG